MSHEYLASDQGGRGLELHPHLPPAHTGHEWIGYNMCSTSLVVDASLIQALFLGLHSASFCCCSGVTEGWMRADLEQGSLTPAVLLTYIIRLTIILTGLSTDCTTLSICGARLTMTPGTTSEHSPPTPTTHTGSTKLGGRRARKGEGGGREESKKGGGGWEGGEQERGRVRANWCSE